MTRQLPLPFPHTPSFDTAPFLRADSNAQALAWLERGQWPQGRLLLWGQTGCGKTHLVHQWSRSQAATIVAGPDVKLEPPQGPVAIDDADLAPEQALLHLLNAAAEAGLSVLMTARQPPSRWSFTIPDLASRLRAVPAIEIGGADDELLRILLSRLLADRQIVVAEPIQEHLLRHLPRTPAALREAAARLDRLALSAGRRVTRALAAAVIAEMGDPDGSDHEAAGQGLPAEPPACVSPNGRALV